MTKPRIIFYILVLTVWLSACQPPQPGLPNPSATAVPPATRLPATGASPTAPMPVIITATAKPPTFPPGAGGPSYDADIEARIQRILAELIPVYRTDDEAAAAAPLDLASRMAYYQTPGLSIAVVNDGRLEWARGFGITNQTTPDPVTHQTLFQAASISTPVSAMGALSLVQQGQLGLDAPINPRLTSWKIPTGQPVTLRQLLSHTAGFGVHGFPGYAIDTPLPTTLEILNGAEPANSPAVTLVNPIGSRFQYSGGGYVVLQQLMMDVTGQAYPELMKQRVLDPLGMSASTYQQPILFEWSGQAASGHTYDSRPLPGGWMVYPEMAPAGLWSTPSDLAQVLIEIDRAASQDAGQVLDQAMAQAMLTPVQNGNGLGLVLPGDAQAAMFGHGGSNQGYRTLMFGVQARGQGAVVMANSDNAMYLIFEIFRAIAREYGWPEVPQWRAVQRETLAPTPADPSSYPTLAGQYRLGQMTFAILARDERLWVQAPLDGPVYPLYPTGPNTFTTLDQAQFTFTRDAAGQAIRLTTNAWGDTELIAQRVSP